jgi:hypothetical protein
MPSAFSPLLRLTLPADGELVGTWGQVVNNGITSPEEAAIAGTATIALADANHTLTALNGAADEARNMTLRITGALTAQRDVICPASSKNYYVRNATTGGFGVNVKTPAGAGVVVPAGTAMLLYCDGTNVVEAVTNFASLTVGGLPVTPVDTSLFVLKTGGTMSGPLTNPAGFVGAASLNVLKTGDTMSGVLTAAGFVGPLSGAATANVLKTGDTMSGALSAPAFVGPLTGLASGNVNRAGDTMTGVLTLNGGFEAGYRDIPTDPTPNPTITAAHRGRMIYVNVNTTIPTLTVDAILSILNYGAGPVTLSPGAGMTFKKTGVGAVGSVTLASEGIATLYYRATDSAYISGPGVS